MKNPLAKPLLLVALVLVLPLVLLAFAGESFSSLSDEWKRSPPSPTIMFLGVAVILATDVFLPVPSGPISTLAGSQLGIIPATLASTIGMTLGGALAFGLARRWGRPLAERLADAKQLDEMQAHADSMGVALLVFSRALPVLAEACVLLLGMLQMQWRVFLPALVASNLLVAATFATLGATAAEYQWLAIALCLSVAVPLFIGLLVKDRFSAN